MALWRSALLASLVTGSRLHESAATDLSDPVQIDALASSFEADLTPLQAALNVRHAHLQAASPRTTEGWALSRQTLDVVAPLADRLGLSGQRALLEDASFRVLDPDAYQAMVASGGTTSAQDLDLLHSLTEDTQALLTLHGIQGAVQGRVKSLYSVHTKMHRKGLPFEAITDRIGLRVLVDSPADCVAVLDLLHTRHAPILDELDDYISHPKPNGYQSIHTAVHTRQGGVAEFQVRTFAMHEQAEGGDAAHWRYKMA